MKTNKLDLIDIMMSTNPYEKSLKQSIKEAVTAAKETEGYSYLSLNEYLDLQTMLNEMEL